MFNPQETFVPETFYERMYCDTAEEARLFSGVFRDSGLNVALKALEKYRQGTGVYKEKANDGIYHSCCSSQRCDR